MTQLSWRPVLPDSGGLADSPGGRARNGDRQAWDALVDRHAPLIWSICRSHRLDAADAEDAAQNVWLQLVDHLDRLPDPAALPGWLATTTGANAATSRAARRPCDGGYAPAARTIPDDHTPAAEQDLPAAERHAAVREAFWQLPPGCQQMLALLIEDPALPYAEIRAGWASRPAASGRVAAAAWTSCAATRPSPR
jgi:DNA-directed RNA polymerase specialized sigma24 family protein